MGDIANLPFDVLPSIFQYLYGSDLVAVALVSWPFSIAALRQLYEHIIIGSLFIKRYGRVMYSGHVSLLG